MVATVVEIAEAADSKTDIDLICAHSEAPIEELFLFNAKSTAYLKALID
jgi:hypothetical protein